MSREKTPEPASTPPRVGGLKRRFPILQKKRGKALVVFLAILPLFGLLGLLALRNHHGGSGNDGASGSEGDHITDDTFFYGQSDPVYPSRKCVL
ncbi:hypothetical protein RRF57_004878 [Xylaria bambusicola]|uniref:Uncharacterized protein n=1 Tax=Xylaria bambusicola TaxID=326684 RepID=A0AAN7UKX4_9PEZI